MSVVKHPPFHCSRYVLHKLAPSNRLDFIYMQERLGEVPGNEEVRASRNGQRLSNETTQPTESEVVQVGNKN